jgi:segregation and condensation protein A
VTSPLNFHLEQYDGPLDLLLDLIRKQQIDIRDIPISTITAQYLDYLDKAREMDINLSAEFVFMAATLIHIKSRMLLPTDPALAKVDDPTDDPRLELVERLIEHEKYKNAAQMLQQKRMIEENVWSNPRMQEFVGEETDPGLAVNLFDLVKAFGEILERVKLRPTYDIQEETVNVADMMKHLRQLLEQTRMEKPLFILQIFEQQRSRRAMICLFLAVLEMVKMQAVEIVQADLFGEIALRKHEHFDAVFSRDTPMPAIEEEYK